MRKLLVSVIGACAVVLTGSPAAWACGGLVAPNGTVRLVRTSTLAAYADGVEHYITSFQFAGGGAEVGSIVPLPAVPTKVERGGDWTLQRLQREVAPPVFEAASKLAVAGAAADDAQVLLETTIDALDITVLKGGGKAVGDWARENGFNLSPDAPEVLDFYADRSPIFMAARFDAAAARARGQELGDGTPIHVTMPTKNPWVPLRILALGRDAAEPVDADVFLLTEGKPALLAGAGDGVRVERSEAASSSLMQDLRSDKGMEWMPSSMWLTFLRINSAAGALDYDLAVDVHGRQPSRVAAGLPRVAVPPLTDTSGTGVGWPVLLTAAALITVVLGALGRTLGRTTPPAAAA